MAHIEVRIPTIQIRVSDTTGSVAVVECIRRGDVDGMRKCIRSKSLHAPREAPLELKLEGMIIGRCRIVRDDDKPKIRIWGIQSFFTKLITTQSTDIG